MLGLGFALLLLSLLLLCVGFGLMLAGRRSDVRTRRGVALMLAAIGFAVAGVVVLMVTGLPPLS